MPIRHAMYLGCIAALAAGCRGPSAVTVELHDAVFATTGSNLYNCETPARPATLHRIGIPTIECDAVRNANGTFSSEPVTVIDSFSCHDGHGAMMSVTCMGNDRDETVSGFVRLWVDRDCSVRDTEPSGPIFEFTDVAPGATAGMPLQDCEAFGGGLFCRPRDECAFNRFGGTVSVSNTSLM